MGASKQESEATVSEDTNILETSTQVSQERKTIDDEKDIEPSTNVSVEPLTNIGRPLLPETDLDRGIVGWDSQDDPLMPFNFSPGRKRALLAQIPAITFISPLATTIFSPGASFMDTDFHNRDALLSSLTSSVYILGYVIGPLFLAPASELWGRRLVCCAVSPNIGSLIAFRFLAGIGGARAMTLIGGVTADLFIPEERGTANALAAIGVIFGPIVGPLFGGFIAQRAGWRWIFWVLCRLSSTLSVLIEIFNKGSYARVLIARKTVRLSKELGRQDLRSCYNDEETPNTAFKKLQQGLKRPLRILFSFQSSGCSALYANKYQWSPQLIGLGSLGIGLGFFVGLVMIGSTSDKLIIKLTKENNRIYEPEMRLPPMVVLAIFVLISFFWYGWSVDKGVRWIIPIIGLVPFGFGM